MVLSNLDELEKVAELLACPLKALEKALCFRTVGNKRDVVEKGHTYEEAVYGKDAFAKVCVCVCVCVCMSINS